MESLSSTQGQRLYYSQLLVCFQFLEASPRVKIELSRAPVQSQTMNLPRRLIESLDLTDQRSYY